MYKIVTSSQNPLQGDNWQNSFLKDYEWVILEQVEPTGIPIKQEAEESSISSSSVLGIQETISFSNYEKCLQSIIVNDNVNILKPTAKRIFECDICKRKFQQHSNLISHKHAHDENYKTDKTRRKCDVCQKVFFDTSTLARHKKIHTEEKPYICELCHKSFSRFGYLSNHWKIHYGDMIIPPNQHEIKREFDNRSSIELKPPVNNKQLNFECDTCHKQFSRKNSLYIHRRLHLPFKCNMCNELFSMQSQFEAHVQNHANITHTKPSEKSREPKANHAFQCDICEKPVISRSLLIEHKRTHFGIKIFQCDICSKKLSSRGNLNVHKRIHTGERPYQCKLCPKAFIEKSKLIIDNRFHTGAKPYECLICRKKFSQRSYLNSHYRGHTGERPFECEICHKFFIESGARNKHRKTHYHA